MEAVGILVIAVTVVAAIVAVVSSLRGGDPYEEIGRLGDLWIYTNDEASPPTCELSREEEQEMVAAISAVREARGEPPRDVEPRAGRRLQPQSPR
jgi:hypothetical protein